MNYYNNNSFGIYICRLQGTCLKGDSCEFSHKIDVQEVANKIIVPQLVFKKEEAHQHHQFTQGDYPQLSSNQASKPYKPTDVNQQVVEDEFPSLASASKIKKPSQSLIKGGSIINFAAAAKKKGSPKSNIQPKKAAVRRTGYHNTQKLTQPVHIPWLDTGSALNSVYMKEVKYIFLQSKQ